MITREIAGQLYGFGYKLIDIYGKTHAVECALHEEISIRQLTPNESPYKSKIHFSAIGKDYFILASALHLYDLIVEKFSKSDDPEFECLFNDEYVDLEEVMEYEIEYLLSKIPFRCAEWLMRHHFPINLPDGTWKEIII